MATMAPSSLTTRPALAATQAGALACWHWIGRGDGKAADEAATAAMRASLAGAPGRGTVIIGEGEKDEAPMLHNGEQVGDGDGPEFDIAVDPLECTDLCAAGLPGALTTIAMARSGSMWSPGPALYMDKIVVGPAAREAIDLRATPEENLSAIAQALGRPVEELTVVVLDKPRHETLIARLRAAGAAVSTPPAGDVAGALAALLPDGGADMLMGVGGTPEGVMTACAVAAMGGGMQGRPAPQLDEEVQALAEAGIDTECVLGLEELVSGPALFVATGVSGGGLLRRPWLAGGQQHTESIVIAPDGVQRIVEGAAQQ
ncbi:MAG: class II fructose-bisphosphatase [Solirubrobacteraceae bacterium MAG38_C4-C5]|nr:class II fructose-bisphosphatase [Candidatus Siliceabacter maunaloa]